MSDFECLEDLTRHRIENRNSPGLFGSDVDQLSVGSHLDSLGLLAHLRRFDHRSRSDVDDADGRIVFVGDVQLGSILADVEVLRIGAALDDANDLLLRDVEYADAVGALIGRRKRAFVDVRDRRSAIR